LNAKHRKAILYRLFLIAAPLTFTAAISGITSVIDLSLIMNRLIGAGLSEERAGSLFGNYTTLVVPMLNLTMALIAPITVAALPNIAALHSTGQNNKLKKNASDYIKITSFVAFPLFFGFLLFSKEILCLLFNDNSATIAYSSLSFISPSILFLPIITMINTVLEGTGHRKAPLIIMSLASVVKLVISYVLLGDKRYLILGAPIGTTVSYTVAFILCVGLLKLYCNIGFDYLFFILRTGIISLLSVSLGKYIYEQITFDIFSPVKFIICVLISIVAYFSISILFYKFVGENIQKHVNLNKNDSQKLLN
jgi:stage V sporulation protein B